MGIGRPRTDVGVGIVAHYSKIDLPCCRAGPGFKNVKVLGCAKIAGDIPLPGYGKRLFHIGCAPGGDSPGVKYRPWENVNRGDITDIYGDSIDDRERWRVTNRRGISGFTGRRHHRKRIRNYSPSGHYDPEALRYAAVKIGIRRRFGR